jgi:hypothetical protein
MYKSTFSFFSWIVSSTFSACVCLYYLVAQLFPRRGPKTDPVSALVANLAFLGAFLTKSQEKGKKNNHYNEKLREMRHDYRAFDGVQRIFSREHVVLARL